MSRCDAPGCTGVHDHSRPRAEWCPAARDRKREYRRRWGNSIVGQTSQALSSIRYETKRRGHR